MKRNRIKMSKFILIAAALLGILIAGCSDKSENSNNRVAAQVSVNLLKTSLAERVDQVNLRIYAEDELVGSFSTPVVNGAFSFGSVIVPVGVVTFVLEAVETNVDGPDQILYGGSTERTVAPGSNINVQLTLTPVVPMVRLSPYYIQTVEDQQVTVSIELWNLAGFNQGTFTIGYDNEALTFVSADAANDAWGGLEVSGQTNDGGGVDVSVFRSQGVESMPPGVNELVNLTFMAHIPGLTELTLLSNNLLDADGPLPEVTAGTLVFDGQSILINQTGTSLGTVSGTVTNASTGEPLAGATVSVSGPASRSTTTDASGNYAMTNLPFGTYMLSVDLSGYINLQRTIQHQSGVTVERVSLSPLLAEGEYRVVLTWGEVPSDLDAHVWTTISEIVYHIYFGNPGQPDVPPLIALDVDDTDSYGPETITIYDLQADCIFAVHNYSGEGGFDAALTESNARIEVYRGAQRLQTFTVPTSGTGAWWHVFDLTANGEIVAHNAISDLPPGAIVKATPKKSPTPTQ